MYEAIHTVFTSFFLEFNHLKYFHNSNNMLCVKNQQKVTFLQWMSVHNSDTRDERIPELRGHLR